MCTTTFKISCKTHIHKHTHIRMTDLNAFQGMVVSHLSGVLRSAPCMHKVHNTHIRVTDLKAFQGMVVSHLPGVLRIASCMHKMRISKRCACTKYTTRTSTGYFNTTHNTHKLRLLTHNTQTRTNTGRLLQDAARHPRPCSCSRSTAVCERRH